jgi:hypothetical protein
MCLIENADSGFSKLGKLVSYRNKYMVFSVNSHLNFSIIILMILKVRGKKILHPGTKRGYGIEHDIGEVVMTQFFDS